MRRRLSSRLLVMDRNDRVLLFRFVFNVAVAGQNYWRQPGGALEAGASFPRLPARVVRGSGPFGGMAVGQEIAERRIRSPTDDWRIRHSRRAAFLFFCRVADNPLSRHHWTPPPPRRSKCDSSSLVVSRELTLQVRCSFQTSGSIFHLWHLAVSAGPTSDCRLPE